MKGWIAFYKTMSQRTNPRTGKPLNATYGPDYAALRLLQRQVQG